MMPTTFFAKKLLEFRQLSIIDGRRGRMELVGLKKYNLLFSPYLRSLFDKGGNKEQAALKAGNLAGAVSSNPRRCAFNILVNYSINSEFFFNCCHTKTPAMNPQHISCRLYDKS